MRDWEERADAGEGSYAIAIALQNVATQLKYLGNGDASTSMGAIEAASKHIGERLDDLVRSIDAISQSIGDMSANNE